MTYSISEAARACGLSAHTLRWYERIGLLDRIGRGSDGHRRFSPDDLDWIALLVKLRGTGMPVAEMKRYAELVRRGEATFDERIDLLEEHRERVVAAMAAQEACLAALDYKITLYRSLRTKEAVL